MDKLERAKRYIKARSCKDERPGFHVTPPVGWMNDPNGVSEYQGKIHLFYQFHPYRDVWGPMHWGHYMTQDFIQWTELPVALAPDREYDAEGCFSGSALVVDGRHYLVYTGVEKKDDVVLQQQCVAEGDGIVYRKIKNEPIISGEMLPAQFSRIDFRDPKIWKDGDTYFLLAGNRNEQGLGQLVLFCSKNMSDWQYSKVFLEHDARYGTMWECPDFFALDGSYVVIISPQDMPARKLKFHNGNNAILQKRDTRIP